jgi:hypothetical protein
MFEEKKRKKLLYLTLEYDPHGLDDNDATLSMTLYVWMGKEPIENLIIKVKYSFKIDEGR